jgi:excisionase family DNA binding protein
MMTVREARKRLRCGCSTVYQLVESGKLQACHIGPNGGASRISETDLHAYLDSCRSRKGDKPDRTGATPKSAGPFTHLDGDRLRAAWQQRGVDAP